VSPTNIKGVVKKLFKIARHMIKDEEDKHDAHLTCSFQMNSKAVRIGGCSSTSSRCRVSAQAVQLLCMHGLFSSQTNPVKPVITNGLLGFT